MTLAILRILEADPSAVVAFFPSDHYYSDGDAFRHAIRSAVLLAGRHAESIILLGAEAHAPEVEYGWIEPGTAIVNSAAAQLFRVSRFWEKPSLAQAQTLLRAGSFWNTFVTIGSARAFLDLLISQIPDVVLAISALLCGGDLDCGFDRVRPVDFSRDVLTPRTDRLLVLRDVASGWTDLGNPSRVADTLIRNRVETDWLHDMLGTPTA
jgi:mannose-1-phosphate guanylyltransferase